MSVRAFFSEILSRARDTDDRASPSSAAEDIRDRGTWQAGVSATILSTLLMLLPRSEAFKLLEPAHETPVELTIDSDTKADAADAEPQKTSHQQDGTEDQAAAAPDEANSHAASEREQTAGERGEDGGEHVEHAIWTEGDAAEIAYAALQTAAAETTSQAHGSSTSPSLLFNAGVTNASASSAPDGGSGTSAAAPITTSAAKAFSSIDNTVVLTATDKADVLTTDVKGATFAFVGPASAENFDVYVDTAGDATVDFSQLETSPSPNDDTTADNETEAGDDDSDKAPALDDSATQTTGIYVDLSAASETNDTAAGAQTVQAWTLDDAGTKDIALAHLEGVDNVVATAGADVLVGNANANTYVYTPTSVHQTSVTEASHHTDVASTASVHVKHSEAAHIEASPEPHTEAVETVEAEHTEATQVASVHVETAHSTPMVAAAEAPVTSARTVDVYSGGSDAAVTTTAAAAASELPSAPQAADNNDTADFSNVETGIKVDLSAETAVIITDVHSGDDVTVTGAMVSTIADQNHDGQDLALLAYTTDGGEEQSSIENLVGSKGADILLGDSSDNTFIFVSTSAVASYFDGRGGNDKADFSSCKSGDGDGGNDGIEVDLSQLVGDFSDAEGDSHDGVSLVVNRQGATLVGLKNIENVTGTSQADIMVGDSHDNTFTGGGGGDTFVFRLLSNKSGSAGLGHDTIADFHVGIDLEHDRIVFSDALLNLDTQAVIDEKINKLMSEYAHDGADGLMFTFDDDSSVLLAGVHMDDFMGADHSLSLSKYDYFFFS